MKVIRATQQMLETRTLVLGFQGENLRTQLRIDCASTFAEYPNATPALAIKPPTGETYPVFVNRDGTEVVWDIVANNLALKGDGELQLTFYKDNVIAKTSIGHITVNRSLQIDGEMPDVVATWIENANRKLAEVDAQIVELEGMVDTATDAAERAAESAEIATEEAVHAEGSAETATEKATEATNAAGTATAKAAEAALSATQARNSAVSAADSERGAIQKAAEAAQSAQTANTKAGQATEAAQTATGKADEASASATAAQASAIDAASSATEASASETAAKASETAAEASATQAAQSVQDAGANAQTATQKAAEASQSATNAATSATSAATSATTASTKAGEAAQSAQVVEETAEQLADSLEQIAQNTADIAEHEQEYNALKEATLIHNTASGSIASFVDGAEMPVDEVTAQINPVQDLHGYDHPWPGGGGINKFPISLITQTKNGTTFTVSDDGAVTISGTPTAQTRVLLSGLAITPDANMVFSVTGSATGVRVFLRANNSGTITYPTISPSENLTANTKYDQFLLEVNTTFPGTATSLKFQLEEGSTATAWTPYSNICPITGWTATQIVVSPTTDAADGQTYPITFPSEAGTVYGGSLTIAEDGSGVLTVDMANVTFDGTETWSTTAAYCYKFGYIPSAQNGGSTQIGSHFATTYIYNGGNSLFAQPNGAIVKSNRTDTVAWASYLAEQYANGTPVQLCYKLATPITYTLTAPEITTLLGENNLWHDANGDISVGYKANTKLYIDGKIAELVARIVNS